MVAGKRVLGALVAVFLVAVIGCATPDGSGGWVIVNPPEQPPGPPPPPPPPPPHEQKRPPNHEMKARGQEQAARNHLQSAYRFLQKRKPDHALKELEKARGMMGTDFWFHYYMGGAYYYKGMYESASVSWKRAFSFTGNPSLRSRARTCQAYAAYHLAGVEVSVDLLERAASLDRRNEQARILLAELNPQGRQSHDRKQGDRGVSDNRSPGTADEQPRFVEEMLGGAKDKGPGGPGPGPKDGGPSQQGEDYNDWSGGSKNKKGSGKDDRKQDRPGKERPGKKRIEDESGFRAYFLVDMNWKQ